eukprot:TRINITY_DN1792_c0_g1_i3.p3 TRINITY_DN1792_c0_g1~~TRINITY_DN1792_c0_g1_i3.p3  ORF type:complete len:119 (+),score=40.45 TRINITY_DN1792_c0_g1_i3:700-1056(+)
MAKCRSMQLASAGWHCSTSQHQPVTSSTPLEREALMGVRQQLWQAANGSSHSSICNRGSGSRAATAKDSGSRQQQPQAETWQAVAADSSSHCQRRRQQAAAHCEKAELSRAAACRVRA